uniref:C2H2-type domain-containing protein n=1 Tax=Pundamilia nyererei TaxID=303518 RepID=A0A3B4FS01_9CICH
FLILSAGCRLSVSSLCLLVPTLRLMCAFAWQVVQCCNVAQYRKVEELVKITTCSLCPYSDNQTFTPKMRRITDTCETPYLCSYCGQGFRSSNILALHVRIHTGDRRYKCPICGKTSIQHLSRHMRMHRGEKNYLCTECGKAFLSSGELRLHMRFHTGERPYTCKHCGKGFIAKCLLTVHTRQHTGERFDVRDASLPTLLDQLNVSRQTELEPLISKSAMYRVEGLIEDN